MEKSKAKELFTDTLQPYSQALLSAIPVASLDHRKERILLRGEISSPINPPDGCRFARRCRYASEKCFHENTQLREITPEHYAACHFIGNLQEQNES